MVKVVELLDQIENKIAGGDEAYIDNESLSFFIEEIINNNPKILKYVEFTSEDGTRYTGEVDEEGCFHGKGTLNHSNGDKYVGDFYEGKLHGKGTYTFGSLGDKYSGGYKDGLKHGKGTYTSADGSVFIGLYKNGLQHGEGTFTSGRNSEHSGEKVKELWENGKRIKSL